MFKFHYPGIGAIVMYMAIEAVAVMVLIILIEVGVTPISHSLVQGSKQYSVCSIRSFFHC